MSRSSDALETAIMAGVLVAGIYIIGGKLASKAVTEIDNVRKQVGSAIGKTLFDWFNPEAGGSMVTIGFQFPNGTYGAVNSDEVSSGGYFNYWKDGSRWRLAVSTDGTKVAVPA